MPSVTDSQVPITPQKWDSPCLKYALITAVVLATLALIIIGALAHREIPPFHILDPVDGIIMATAGAKILSAGIVWFFIYTFYNVISHQDLNKYKSLLQEGEFLVYGMGAQDGFEKRIYINSPDFHENKFKYSTHYQQFKTTYTQVYETDLQKREQSR